MNQPRFSRLTTGSLSKVFRTIFVWILLFPTLGMGPRFPAAPGREALRSGSALSVGGNVLSDGQFVYGPNVENFDLKQYLQNKAPSLSQYAEALHGRAKYFSISPRVYLTLLEVHSHLISLPDASHLENPLGLDKGGFLPQIDEISGLMLEAYYRHLYTYSSEPVSGRQLAPLPVPGGGSLNVSPETNAGTYAILAALASMENEQDIPGLLDRSQSNGFYQTYRRLFPDDNPASTTNHIYTSAELNAETAPDNFLQLPYLNGKSWMFGGVHNNTGGSTGSSFTDASSLDFSPGWPSWNSDTSDMWVAAAAAGTPEKISNCHFEIHHAGGWETSYYHLENIQNFSGWINQNDKIGVIANTLSEAICDGGSSTGPHVHFSLKRNGAFVAINGSPLSGWYVHSGRWNYDTSSSYMWLERSGIRKYAGNPLLSEPTSAGTGYVTISGNTQMAGVTLQYTDGTARTATSQADGSYSFLVTNHWSGSVTPTYPCYAFSPSSLAYTNITSDQTGQNFTPGVDASVTCVSSVTAADPNPTAAGSVHFTVTFSNNVSGVDAGDFALTTTGLTGAAMTAISGSGDTYTVTVNTGTGTGTIRLDLRDDDSIQDINNNPLAGAGAGNGNFTAGEIYTIAQAANVTIGTQEFGPQLVLPNPASIVSQPNLVSGPVKVTSVRSGNLFTSERVISGNSFNEVMGYPANQLTTDYWFPWYDNVNMATWVLVGNASSTQAAAVSIYVGTAKYNYTIPIGGCITPRYPDLVNGPIRVVSTNGVKIFTSERAQYNGIFNEVTGYPASQLTTDYWFPWYDNVSMNTWVLVGNPSSTTANVDIYIGGVKKLTQAIPPGGKITPRFNLPATGPVRVVSTNGVKIFTSERAQTDGSFNEVMGYPASQLTTEYWFPWYDNVSMNTWVLVGNPTGSTASVSIYIGGVRKLTQSIPPGGQITPRFGALQTGPVRVVSTNGVKIFSSERVSYGSSFNEFMGYPGSKLTTEYWFPWYDSVTMSTEIMVGRP